MSMTGSFETATQVSELRQAFAGAESLRFGFDITGGVQNMAAPEQDMALDPAPVSDLKFC